MKKKILLVDDREDNLFSMETILETSGYHFAKAQSGRQALKILLVEFDFALILMDVQMPNLNGFETAALIYESKGNVDVAKETRVESDIKSIVTQIKVYEARNLQPPTTEQGLKALEGSQKFYRAVTALEPWHVAHPLAWIVRRRDPLGIALEETIAFLLVLVLRLLEQFRAGRVERERDLVAEFVAGLLDRGRDRRERLVGRRDVRGEPALVADRGV